MSEAIKQQNLIGPHASAMLLEKMRLLDRAYFVPTQNAGINGEIGDYYSCMNKAIPADILNELIEAVAHVPDRPHQIVINYYPAGSHSPKHIDAGDHIGCFVLTLEDRHESNSMRYDGATSGDRAGSIYNFINLKEPHWVQSLDFERYSVVYLFGGRDEIS